MKMNNFKNWFIKNSDDILMGLGLVCLAAGTVATVIATKEVIEVKKGMAENLEELTDNHDESLESGDLTAEQCAIVDKEYKKAVAMEYVKGGLKIGALFLPTVAFDAVAVYTILKSRGRIEDLKKTNAALAAANAATAEAFSKYRERVVARFGEEVDHELRYGITKETVTDTVVGEDGKKHKEKSEISVIAENFSQDEFLKIFGRESSPAFWENDFDYMQDFVLTRQNMVQNKLDAGKKVYLNDVLDMLGMENTKAGQVAGWLPGDRVDFGIDCAYENSTEYHLGTPCLLMCFNCRNDIWSMED